MSLKFNIRGFDEINKALNKKIEAVTIDIDKEMTASALEINAKQISYTPIDTGRLRGGNGFDVSKPLNKQLFNMVDYAPYIEFGTGGLTTIPQGMEEIASQFKGTGIRKINMRAQPFFFRAFFEVAPKMLARIKKIIIDNDSAPDWTPTPFFPIIPPPAPSSGKRGKYERTPEQRARDFNDNHHIK